MEEAARIVGYDKIPVEIPAAPVKNTGLTLDQRRLRRWRTTSPRRLTETLSYLPVGDEDYEALPSTPTSRSSPWRSRTRSPATGRSSRRTHVPTPANTTRRNIRRGMDNVQTAEPRHLLPPA